MTAGLSAHRCGAGGVLARENTLAALTELLADPHPRLHFVELDVQVSACGSFLLSHDALIAGAPIAEIDHAAALARHPERAELHAALELIRPTSLGAHLDLKELGVALDPPEIAICELALSSLPPSRILLTTHDDAVVARLRSWARSRDIPLQVGLSLGRPLPLSTPLASLRTLFQELFPARRLRRCDATIVVSHHLLARLTLARTARRLRLPLLVWTVDHPRALRRWLAEPTCTLVVTNHPDHLPRS